MALSNDLVTQFAKLSNQKFEETNDLINGTVKVINGKEYVRLDGSDILTPVISTVDVEEDERVSVRIKDHAATIISNITSPAARSRDVQTLKDEVDENGNTIKRMDNTITQQGNSIIQMNNSINQQQNTINQHNNRINQQNDTIVSLNNTVIAQGNEIEANNNAIELNGNQIEMLNDTVRTHGNNIVLLENTVQAQGNRIQANANDIIANGNQIVVQQNIINQQGNLIEQQGNTIIQHNSRISTLDSTVTAQGSNIQILNSGFSIVDGVLTGLSSAVINSLKTNSLNAAYATIDFSNIQIAAIEKLFTDSGIINDLVVQEGHITGELVGVTISGDLIQGNTVKADKLVVLGSDGLYYKLNVTGETIEAQQTAQNSLNGSVITAQSITANKISVDDLVAFNATIGGFDINNNSINTHTKASMNSDANGLYFGSDGQLYVGSGDTHIKYYKVYDEKDETYNWFLDITADSIKIGTSNISTELDNIRNTNTNLQEQIAQNTALIEQSGQGIMTQVNEVISSFTDNYNNMNSDLEEMTERFNALIQQNTTLIQQYANSIISSVKSTGGTNLLRNSVGYSDTDFWLVNGNVTTNQDDNMSLSGSEFILNGAGYISQGFSTTPGKEYSLNCLIKHTSVGTADNIKIEILGQGDNKITVLDTDQVYSNWTMISLESPYLATITNPTVKITNSGNDILEITDLMISLGDNAIWSGYVDEVYGKEHKLDGKGLRLSDLSSKRSSKTTSSNFQLLNGTDVVAELSKEKVKSDTGEFADGYSIGRLRVMRLDDDNIIEYV